MPNDPMITGEIKTKIDALWDAELINPVFKKEGLWHNPLSDKVCGPAMGTAGFIVEAAKYIRGKFGL